MSCRSSSCALLLLALLALCAASGAVELHAAASLGRRFGGDSGAAATAAAPQGLVVGGRRYRLRLRYTACTGLVNQQYSHIAAFTLAAALGVAEVHLPPAAVRDSFAHKFSIHQEENQILWFAERPECLLDVARLRQSWAALGVTVVEVRRRRRRRLRCVRLLLAALPATAASWLQQPVARPPSPPACSRPRWRPSPT